MQACARDLVSARIYTTCGGGRVYDVKTLRSNLAPEEGGGTFIRGGRIIEQVRYLRINTIYHLAGCQTSKGYVHELFMYGLRMHILLSHPVYIGEALNKPGSSR